METKKVTVGIKDLESVLKDFVETGKQIEKGESVKKEKGVYFTDIEAFRKAITPKRLALLRAIRKNKPSSIRHLSRITDRDVKNVSNDIRFLEQAGLIELAKNDRRDKDVMPCVNYDSILFEISV